MKDTRPILITDRTLAGIVVLGTLNKTQKLERAVADIVGLIETDGTVDSPTALFFRDLLDPEFRVRVCDELQALARQHKSFSKEERPFVDAWDALTFVD